MVLTFTVACKRCSAWRGGAWLASCLGHGHERGHVQNAAEGVSSAGGRGRREERFEKLAAAIFTTARLCCRREYRAVELRHVVVATFIFKLISTQANPLWFSEVKLESLKQIGDWYAKPAPSSLTMWLKSNFNSEMKVFGRAVRIPLVATESRRLGPRAVRDLTILIDPGSDTQTRYSESFSRLQSVAKLLVQLMLSLV